MKTWNNSYENDIDDDTAGSLIDDNIRTLKSEIRKRLETFFDNWANDPDAPTTLEVKKGDNLFLGVPVGTIVALVNGYFTDGSNGGFTSVTVSLGDRWKLCDGSELNDSESPIFNGSGRYLPNLTDNRFLMGSTSPGTSGGSSDATKLTGITQPAFTYPNHHHKSMYIRHSQSEGSGNLEVDFYLDDGSLSNASSYVGAVLVDEGGTASGSNYNKLDFSTWGDYFDGTKKYLYTAIDGGGNCTRTTNVSINLPNYLTCKYVMRIK